MMTVKTTKHLREKEHSWPCHHKQNFDFINSSVARPWLLYLISNLAFLVLGHKLYSYLFIPRIVLVEISLQKVRKCSQLIRILLVQSNYSYNL